MFGTDSIKKVGLPITKYLMGHKDFNSTLHYNQASFEE